MEIDDFYERYYEFTHFRNLYPLPNKVLKVCDEMTDNDTYPIIKNIVAKYKNPAILDMGAGHRKLKCLIESLDVGYDYKSVDKATNFEHDYQNINDIKEKKFDIIFMMEVIEHLTLTESLLYLTKIFDLLNKNGTFIVSTPNAHHINQLWKSNITHIQQYPGSDLCAILRMIGYSSDTKMYRLFIKSNKFNIKQYFKVKLRVLITKILDTDYAHGILVVATK